MKDKEFKSCHNYTRNTNLLSFGFKPLNDGSKKMEIKNLPKLDVTKYIGTETEIVKAEVIKTKYGLCIKVESAPIPLKDGDTMKDGSLFTASILLNVYFDEENDCHFIATESKTAKFIHEHDINIADIPEKLSIGMILKAFEGKTVICQKSVNGYLEIA